MSGMLPRPFLAPSLAITVAAAFAASAALAESNANWPRWRGPADNGSNVVQLG